MAISTKGVCCKKKVGNKLQEREREKKNHLLYLLKKQNKPNM